MAESRDYLELSFRSIRCFAHVRPEEIDPAPRQQMAEIARKIGA